jgi:hypothetical protein
LSPSLIRLVALLAVLAVAGLAITKALLQRHEHSTHSADKSRASKPKKPTEDKILDTSLLRLKLQSFPITKIEPSVQSRQGTIVAIGDRILLADRSGHFFAIDIKGDAPTVKLLRLHIDLHEKELLDFAAGRGAVGTYLLRVLKLATLDHGRKLAASYSAWDAESQCANLYVATIDLAEDWSKIDPGTGMSFSSRSPVSGSRLMVPAICSTVIKPGVASPRSRPAFLPLSSADFGFDGLDRSPSYPQDPDADYGKAITIDTNTGASTQYAIGLPNPQGLTFDSKGRLWLVEHGPKGGDELNLIKQGGNYGWPLVTLGTPYFGHARPQSRSWGRHEGYDQPVFA